MQKRQRQNLNKNQKYGTYQYEEQKPQQNNKQYTKNSQYNPEYKQDFKYNQNQNGQKTNDFKNNTQQTEWNFFDSQGSQNNQNYKQDNKRTKPKNYQIQKVEKFANQKPVPQKFNDQNQSNNQLKTVNLITNQFRLYFHNEYVIHIYSVQVYPDIFDIKLRIREIMNILDKKLQQNFINYLSSGFNLFSPVCVQDELVFDIEIDQLYKLNKTIDLQYLKKKVLEIQSNDMIQVIIKKVSQFNFENYYQGQQMESNPIQLQFINLLIQKLMRSNKLQQVGRNPRFFDPQSRQILEDQELGRLEIWSGYKASSYIYNSGVYIVLESINKFCRKDSCLDIYNRLKQQNKQNMDLDQIKEFFKNKLVFTTWGTKRNYKISRLQLDKTPINSKFNLEEDSVTIYQYFKDKYNIDLQKDQPMLEVGNREKDQILLPSQLCFIESIPEALKKRRDILGQFKKTPKEKIDSVQSVMQSIGCQEELREQWGIEISTEPYQLQSRILQKPCLITGRGKQVKREITGKESYSQQILIPISLKKEKWAIVYSDDDYNEANILFELMIVSSERLGLLIEEPQWINIYSQNNNYIKLSDFEDIIYNQIDEKQLRAVAVIIPKPIYYSKIKRILDKKQIVSQIVLKNNVRKGSYNNGFGLSFACELLKQINIKGGGDLYHITLPKLIYQHTMLVGIDVCHSGPSSIYGFCATMNKSFTQYYSNVYYQKKYKEIGSQKDLKLCFQQALEAYEYYNNNAVEHIIIFRDGVGDSMRQKVKSEELNLLLKLLKETYKINQPKVTLVIVNKRINQRFFQLNQVQNIKNPPEGTIIDSDIVQQQIQSTECEESKIQSNQIQQDQKENINKNENNEYDFFLISQTTTQGCILPTHFFVSFDNSGIQKQVLQELTYNLCYFYFNWSGSIKVPSPCQYAHKVAKYALDIKDKPKSNQNLYFL